MYYFLNAIKIKSVRRNKPRNIIYPLKKQHIGSLLIKKNKVLHPFSQPFPSMPLYFQQGFIISTSLSMNFLI